MKVTLLSSTPDALDVLLFTKNTRLTMNGVTLDEIRGWPLLRKMEELRKMRNTVQSSWEFVDYVFAIEDVTRAFTHQLVRQRVGTSFAQQSQRAVDMEGFGYLLTGDLSESPDGTGTARYSGRLREEQYADPKYHRAEKVPGKINPFDWAMFHINEAYRVMLDRGVKAQDARGVLPTNVLTNIVFKANLRTLHEMALKRLCVRTQGEFQDVVWALIAAVVEVHPWAEPFFRVQCAWNGTCLYPLLPVDQCHVKPWVYDPEHAMSYGQYEGGKYAAHSLATTDEIYQIHRSKRLDLQPPVTK
jgi:flavin-dependent thymidylate synthase